MSLVKRHLQKHAQTPGAAAGTEQPKQTAEVEAKRSELMQAFDHLKAVLETDLGQLKTFNNIKEKSNYKQKVLSKNGYLQYVQAYIKSGANHPNTVLVWVFIWLVDLKSWASAFELLPTLIKQQQKLPKRFNTPTFPIFLGDYLYDNGNELLSAGIKDIKRTDIRYWLRKFVEIAEGEHWLDASIQTSQEIDGQAVSQVSQIILGKVYAMLGKLELACHNKGYALDYFISAQKTNEAAGVKTLRNKLATELDIHVSD